MTIDPTALGHVDALHAAKKVLHHDLTFLNASKSPFIHISNFGKRAAAEGGKGMARSKVNATCYKLRVIALTSLRFGFTSSDITWSLDNKGRLHCGKITQHIQDLQIKEGDIVEASIEDGRIYYTVNGARV